MFPVAPTLPSPLFSHLMTTTSALKNGQLKTHVDSINYQAQQSDIIWIHLVSLSQDLLEFAC
jgi:hypothetical protein